MGTRADYYIGRGPQAEWIGSTAWDGFPENMPFKLIHATTEQGFREAVSKMAQARDDFTSREQGWPWPWNDSGTTDYAYAFDNGEVYYTFLDFWWKASDGEPTEEDEEREDLVRAVFPDMSSRKNVTMGQRSGLMIFHRS